MSGLADLATEAMNSIQEGIDDLDAQIEQALSCPCIGDLKDGPCGQTFVGAFTCYIKSTHEEKGMDCLDQFKLFQECLKQHPDHVEKIMQDATSDQVVDDAEESNGIESKSESPS